VGPKAVRDVAANEARPFLVLLRIYNSSSDTFTVWAKMVYL
jgi:hypothetical protein